VLSFVGRGRKQKSAGFGGDDADDGGWILELQQRYLYGLGTASGDGMVRTTAARRSGQSSYGEEREHTGQQL
jgi:hypothetical protein